MALWIIDVHMLFQEHQGLHIQESRAQADSCKDNLNPINITPTYV